MLVILRTKSAVSSRTEVAITVVGLPGNLSPTEVFFWGIRHHASQSMSGVLPAPGRYTHILLQKQRSASVSTTENQIISFGGLRSMTEASITEGNLDISLLIVLR